MIGSDQVQEASSFSLPASAFPANGLYIAKISTDKNFYQTKILKSGT